MEILPRGIRSARHVRYPQILGMKPPSFRDYEDPLKGTRRDVQLTMKSVGPANGLFNFRRRCMVLLRGVRNPSEMVRVVKFLKSPIPFDDRSFSGSHQELLAVPGRRPRLRMWRRRNPHVALLACGGSKRRLVRSVVSCGMVFIPRFQSDTTDANRQDNEECR
jgi:hypothetical protein